MTTVTILLMLAVFVVIAIVLHWLSDAVDYILWKLGADDRESDWWG